MTAALEINIYNYFLKSALNWSVTTIITALLNTVFDKNLNTTYAD